MMDRGSIHFGPEVYSSQSLDNLPFVEIGSLSDEIFASYSGPDDGLAYGVDERENGTGEVAGATGWNMKNQKAYGICISLYEQHPVNGKMSGDPVADAFAICARQNNCVMLIADGVNWGEKSRLAARSALYGSMLYINHKIFKRHRQPVNTHEVFEVLRASFDEAHKVIMQREGGLTTLCTCFVCPVKNSSQFAMCCLNVGDSYAYVFSQNQGIREVTQGSHDVSLVRDIRDAGGALGPVDGNKPELHNMTYALSFVNTGDKAFLTTDGISDNFDPVVTKIAIAKLDYTRAETVKIESSPDIDGAKADLSGSSDSSESSSTSPSRMFCTDKPEMEPKERHIYSLKEMERIVHEFEFVTEEEISAQELCSALAQHVLLLTDKKRKVLEDPDLYKKRKMTQKDKIRRDSEIVSKMSAAPGKLDHASIVAFEVGLFTPNEDDMECIPLGGTFSSESHSSDSQHSKPFHSGAAASSKSPHSHKKKLRPKKLFSKIRNLSVGSSPHSPSCNVPQEYLSVSPKKVPKRTRPHQHSNPSTPSSPPGIDALTSPVFGYIARPRMSPSPVTSPVSSPISPGPSTGGIPIPGRHPYRNTMSFESSV